MNKLKIALSVVIALFITCGLFGGDSKRIPIHSAKPQEGKVYPIAIIGAGAGGTMATKRAVLNNQEVLLFTGAKKEQKNSRGTWVRKVDNVPGLEKYKRTILELRNDTLKDLANGPFKQNLFVIQDSVVSLKKEEGVFVLRDKAGGYYEARHVILATGMMDEQPKIKGSIKPILPYANNQSIAYCLLCDGHRSYQKNTAILGYSDDAAGAALLVVARYQPKSVTILTNGHKPTFSPEVDEMLKAKGIVVMQEKIERIVHGQKKKQLAGFDLESNKHVAAEIGFVFLGIRPNNKLAKEVGAKLDARGLVITDEKGETEIRDLFVVGDLRANSAKQIYTAWQQAVDAVQIIDRRIRAEKG